MDLNSRAFTEAVKALNDVGLLDPQKLAVTPVSSLPNIADLATEGWKHVNCTCMHCGFIEIACVQGP